VATADPEDDVGVEEGVRDDELPVDVLLELLLLVALLL
jgi:hypothetical protein